jgi:hypothetical protein
MGDEAVQGTDTTEVSRYAVFIGGDPTGPTLQEKRTVDAGDSFVASGADQSWDLPL